MLFNKMNKRNRRSSISRMTEINITPMVDVMTVLLSVFMVTAPLLTTGMEVNLPKGAKSAIHNSEKALDIVIDSRGKIFLGTEEVTIKLLKFRLKAMKQNNPDLGVIISGDQNSNYGKIIEVMGKLKDEGFTKVGLKTKSQNGK